MQSNDLSQHFLQEQHFSCLHLSSVMAHLLRSARRYAQTATSGSGHGLLSAVIAYTSETQRCKCSNHKQIALANVVMFASCYASESNPRLQIVQPPPPPKRHAAVFNAAGKCRLAKIDTTERTYVRGCCIINLPE